jgi:hypothetical protein
MKYDINDQRKEDAVTIYDGNDKRSAPTCPECGGELLPHRRFCRPSCRARFEHRDRPLLIPALTMESEF